jgi:hypothetical protein
MVCSGVRKRVEFAPLRKSTLIPILIFLAGLAASPLAAAPSWHELRAPDFTILSQVSEKDSRAWADEFEQFILALHDVVPPDPGGLPPLTVVLFADPRQFSPYIPLAADGRPIDAAGFFSRHPTWAIIGLARHAHNEAETRHIIFHEGVHWCMGRTSLAYPLWFNEGLAEVFSTFRIQDGQARWGDPLFGHVALLREQEPLPVEKLLAVTQASPLYYQKHRIGIFYAESWALVHYMLFGRRAGARSDLFYYFQELKTGMAPDKAFEVAFGTDYAGMDETLREYVSGPAYAVTVRDLPPASGVTAAFVAASPLLVEKTLENLAYSSRRLDVARQHAEALLKLSARSP